MNIHTFKLQKAATMEYDKEKTNEQNACRRAREFSGQYTVTG